MVENLAEELLGARFRWIVKKSIDIGGIHQNLPLSHKDDAVRHLAGKAHLMGYDNHGHSFFGQLLHDI